MPWFAKLPIGYNQIMSRKLIAAAAATFAFAIAAIAGAATGVAPGVRFAGLTPVKVQGSHFIPSEHVLLKVSAGKTRLTRTVLVSRGGAFTVNFGAIPARDRCSGVVSITATGLRGDSAAYKLPQMACPMIAGAIA